MRSELPTLLMEATICHRVKTHSSSCLVKICCEEMLQLSLSGLNPELCVHLSNYPAGRIKYGHSSGHFIVVGSELTIRMERKKSRMRLSRTAGKTGAQTGVDSITCPGNPRSAGHLTQPREARQRTAGGRQEGWM